MSKYSYVWEYRVRLDRIREFEAVYGPKGEWVRLFRREAYAAFRRRFGTEFDAVDERCERLTETETRLGDFESVD